MTDPAAENASEGFHCLVFLSPLGQDVYSGGGPVSTPFRHNSKCLCSGCKAVRRTRDCPSSRYTAVERSRIPLAAESEALGNWRTAPVSAAEPLGDLKILVQPLPGDLAGLEFDAWRLQERWAEIDMSWQRVQRGFVDAQGAEIPKRERCGAWNVSLQRKRNELAAVQAVEIPKPERFQSTPMPAKRIHAGIVVAQILVLPLQRHVEISPAGFQRVFPVFGGAATRRTPDSGDSPRAKSPCSGCESDVAENENRETWR